MFKLGSRWRGRDDGPGREQDPPAAAGEVSDAEVIARAARHTLTGWDIAATMPAGAFADFVLDMRAVLVKSPAARAVLKTRLAGRDPVDVLAGERDAALAERDHALSELADLRTVADELARTRIAFEDFVDQVLDAIPEDWDGDADAHSIALAYVQEMNTRLDAMRIPRGKHPEDGNGAVWPDATTDPNGFADAADAYRAYHSGCRCAALGENTAEHRRGALCIGEVA